MPTFEKRKYTVSFSSLRKCDEWAKTGISIYGIVQRASWERQGIVKTTPVILFSLFFWRFVIGVTGCVP